MAELPARAPEAEEQWLSGLRELDDERLGEAVKACLRAGRPQLAARVVGLLGGESDDPEILKARRAARLLCLNAPRAWEAELDELLARIRQRHMRRATLRARDRLKRPDRVGQTPTQRSRRRRR